MIALRHFSKTCFKNQIVKNNLKTVRLSSFVSEHFKVEKEEILSLLKTMDTETRQKTADGPIEVKVCKLCPKKNKTNADNIWKLNVRQNGSYHCYRCSKSGTWFDLKRLTGEKYTYSNLSDNMDGLEFNSATPAQAAATKEATGKLTKAKATTVTNDDKKYVFPSQKQLIGYHQSLFPLPNSAVESADDLTRRTTVKTYLNDVRGLNDEVLTRYGIGLAMQQYLVEGVWNDRLCVTFPWAIRNADFKQEHVADDNKADLEPLMKNGDDDCMIVRFKSRALETKGMQRIAPSKGMWGFFGWHLVKPTDTSIIITEGEYDAMAVAQGLAALPLDDPMRAVSVVSLPNGCNSLPTELIPLLEPFKKVYLWMDNDKSGIDASEKFARKLGITRCLVVKPLKVNSKDAPKDANDALRLGDPNLIPAMLRAAKMMAHSKIQVFADLKAEVYASIRRLDQREGAQVESMPLLCKLTKGFRKGELVIFTGPTGSGKTTLLSQMSMDFAKSGAPTLWGSFEIKNHRLVHKMLQQSYKYGHLHLIDDDKLEQVAADFEALPLQFMNFHGSTAIDEILDAMEYAVYKDDIQHIIIDNLQFMMPRGPGVSAKHAFEKFDFQDAVIDKFRRFATEKNVNVIVVIHPRKEDDATSLGISSIFGTAKATQEADLVLILQKNADGLMSLDVKKNRYDGQLGRIPLDFNATSLCFVESDRVAPAPSPPKSKGKPAPSN